MAVSTKIIRRRIRSVTNTKKVTKAMELVSGAKMRKAVRQTLASRAYAGSAWEIVRRLAERTDPSLHPLFVHRSPVTHTAVITISANRGLCGSFNTQVAARALSARDGGEVAYLTIGGKARDAIRRAGASLVADYVKPDVTTSVTEVSALSRAVVAAYMSGEYDRVFIAANRFVSSLQYTTELIQLLPLHTGAPEASSQQRPSHHTEYLFEPSPAAVLDTLVPRLIELRIYQAVLESDAAEHSARMLAMRNATDAAGEMIDDLTLTFNQARQAGITREIAEIAGGKAALE